ncbi:MAG: hypothetical protein KF716_08835 [Anaerolineae bacterium]|nr:hypothetical protein [Anaerolineae bacterium]
MNNRPDWMKLLDQRQQQEILFAQTYHQNFGHGTDGHHRLLIIAKLSDMLTHLEGQGIDLLLLLQTGQADDKNFQG